jgi:isoleucyl-tRNA synthetase
VPYLVKYIDNLTNIYVRFNRKRLKGRTGEEDYRISLSTLYHVSTHLAWSILPQIVDELLRKKLNLVHSL